MEHVEEDGERRDHVPASFRVIGQDVPFHQPALDHCRPVCDPTDGSHHRQRRDRDAHLGIVPAIAAPARTTQNGSRVISAGERSA